MKNQPFKTIVLAILLAASVAACKKKGGGGGGGGLGVPECDDYFAKMDACAKKTGGPAGEGLTRMSAMMSKAWKEEVGDPEKKKALAGVCTSAIRDMKKQMPDCDWGGDAMAPEGSGTAPEGSGAAPEGSGAAPEGSAGSGAPEGSAGSGSAAPAGSATP